MFDIFRADDDGKVGSLMGDRIEAASDIDALDRFHREFPGMVHPGRYFVVGFDASGRAYSGYHVAERAGVRFRKLMSGAGEW